MSPHYDPYDTRNGYKQSLFLDTHDHLIRPWKYPPHVRAQLDDRLRMVLWDRETALLTKLAESPKS